MLKDSTVRNERRKSKFTTNGVVPAISLSPTLNYLLKSIWSITYMYYFWTSNKYDEQSINLGQKFYVKFC